MDGGSASLISLIGPMWEIERDGVNEGVKEKRSQLDHQHLAHQSYCHQCKCCVQIRWVCFCGAVRVQEMILWYVVGTWVEWEAIGGLELRYVLKDYALPMMAT